MNLFNLLWTPPHQLNGQFKSPGKGYCEYESSYWVYEELQMIIYWEQIQALKIQVIWDKVTKPIKKEEHYHHNTQMCWR